MHKSIYSIASPVSRHAAAGITPHTYAPQGGIDPLMSMQAHTEQQGLHSAWYGMMNRLRLEQYAQHPVVYFRLSGTEAAVLSTMLGGFSLMLAQEANASCIIEAEQINALEQVIHSAKIILAEREAAKEQLEATA
ncbi:hypothetical protein [Vibrio phage BONAISHI]|nr:hypothetical protein [Vibrio phage BONAISHI]